MSTPVAEKRIPCVEQVFKPYDAAWWAARYRYFQKKKALRGMKVEVPTLEQLVQSQVELAVTCKEVFGWSIGKRELREYAEKRIREELAHKDVAYWVKKEPKKRDVDNDNE